MGIKRVIFPLVEEVEPQERVSMVYGMRSGMVTSSSSQPINGLIEVGTEGYVNNEYFGSFLTYNRVLTDVEVRAYNLKFIGWFNHDTGHMEYYKGEEDNEY